MRTYRQLTLEQRYQISAGIKAGFTQQQIADDVGCNKSTISRELRRLNGADYCPKSAYLDAFRRRHLATKATLYDKQLWALVVRKLQAGWSPAAIAGRIRFERDHYRLTHETIYQWIYKDRFNGGHVHRSLLRAYRGFRKPRKHHNWKGLAPHRDPIGKRPKAANNRLHCGHWEGDTVHGSDGSLVTLVDRKSRFLEARKIERRTMNDVTEKLTLMLNKHTAKTLTIDNGSEFFGHQTVSKKTSTKVYFADPYSSWQRGSNEHANGLLRRVFPKGTNFNDIPAQKLRREVEKINLMPRKIHGWKTAYEIHYKTRVALIT